MGMDGPTSPGLHNMSPGILEEYMVLMQKYGVQGLQLEHQGIKIIISGIDPLPVKDPATEENDIDREELLDELRK